MSLGVRMVGSMRSWAPLKMVSGTRKVVSARAVRATALAVGVVDAARSLCGLVVRFSVSW